VRANLIYGHKYRGTVTVEPLFRPLVTDALIAAELARWQLHGQVTETETGYTVEAKFSGMSGNYELPEAVRTFEAIE
jgi:hypothetical protein